MSAVPRIPPALLIVRCLAERKGNQWQAFSLEFGLAVQADSLAEVKSKLEAMISGYVTDALVGQDREHAHELLTRRARWQIYARFYLVRALSFVVSLADRISYREPLPVEPVHMAA